MHKNKKRKAFTLIELLIVIALIGMFILTASNMNFEYMSLRQKSEMFANNIIHTLETMRNDALIGRGVYDLSNNLIIPTRWKISITKQGIQRGYFDTTGYKKLDNENIISRNKRNDANKIGSIFCDNKETTNEINYIDFENKNATITHAGQSCNALIITTNFNGGNPIQITFDSVSGLITKKYVKN